MPVCVSDGLCVSVSLSGLLSPRSSLFVYVFVVLSAFLFVFGPVCMYMYVFVYGVCVYV